MPVQAAKSDAVAEAALGALVALLGRVTLANSEQLTGLLQRLLPVATLPRTAAAEEVSCAAVQGFAHKDSIRPDTLHS